MSGDDPGTCAGRVGPEAALDTEKIAAACDALLDAFGARRIFECRALETRSEQSAACWPAPSAECVLTYVVVPVVALWALYLLLYEVLLLKALPFLIERWYKSDGNAHNRLRDPKHLLPFVTSLLFIVFIPIELYHFCAGLGDVVFEWRATAVRPNLFALTFGALKGAIDEPGEIVTKILELYGLKSLVHDIRTAQCEALGLEWRQDRGFSEQVSISLNIVDERGFFGMRTISDVSLTKLFPNGYACSIVKEAAKHADTEDGPTIAVGGGARRRHPFLKVEPCRAQFGRDGPTEADTIHRQLTDQLKNCLSSCFGPGNIVEDLACEQRVTEAYVCALTHEKWGRASRRSVQPEDAHHNITSEKAAHLEKIANEKYRVYLIRKSALRDLKASAPSRRSSFGLSPLTLFCPARSFRTSTNGGRLITVARARYRTGSSASRCCSCCASSTSSAKPTRKPTRTRLPRSPSSSASSRSRGRRWPARRPPRRA